MGKKELELFHIISSFFYPFLLQEEIVHVNLVSQVVPSLMLQHIQITIFTSVRAIYYRSHQTKIYFLLGNLA